MKIKKRLYSVVIASASLVLFLILVSSVVSADSLPIVAEKRITTHESVQNPDIYGNTIVWEDWSNGNGDIYIYDISTSREIHTTNESNQTNPAIYGNRVVWEDERNGGHDIYLQDLSTKAQTRITNSGKAYNPTIYGDKIVWTDGRSGGSFDEYGNPIGKWDIYMFDLSSNKETQITTSGSAISPDIYGNRIVWQDKRNEISDIYMFDLSTLKETQVTASGSAASPAIYEDRVVCQEAGNYNTDIYMYNLSTLVKTQITDYGMSHDSEIYGDRIVYEDFGRDTTGNTDILMYDLSTGKTMFISPEDEILSDPEDPGISGNPYQVDPAIYNNRIVWADYREERGIYMGTLVYPPAAAFIASPISGKAPLTVKFTDQSTGSPSSWNWSFGDGTNSTQKSPTHIYSAAGNYTVGLTVSNQNGNNTETKTGYINVIPVSSKLVAAFSASPTTGNAPLNVAFIDTSTGSPTSWNWNFGDGATSNQQNPEHTYSSMGNYIVNLTVSNENETASNTATITALEQSYSSGGSDNGGSSDESSSSGGSGGGSRSGGGGGGGGGSPEPQSNVEVKELSQAFVTSGSTVKFDFPQKVTAAVYVSFDSKKTLGKITTIAEMLKGKSALVPELPAGEVYKYFNVWVGNGGVATSKNIENPVLCFRVEKSWMQNRSIDPASIVLNIYNDQKWEKLPVNMSEEDSEYLYLTANVSGFSSFAITGNVKSTSDQPKESLSDIGSVQLTNDTNDTVIKGANEKKTPGFGIVFGIVCLLGVFLYKRNK